MNDVEKYGQLLKKNREHEIREGHRMIANLQGRIATLKLMIEHEEGNHDTDPEANGDRVFYETLADQENQIFKHESDIRMLRSMMPREERA